MQYIKVIADFALTNRVNITRTVKINGNGKTITGPTAEHGLNISGANVEISNLTVTGSGKSNIQFYEATGGKLTNVTLSDAKNAGLIVNGSEVTVSGVTTTNNAWGGINVDKGGNADQSQRNKFVEMGDSLIRKEVNLK